MRQADGVYTLGVRNLDSSSVPRRWPSMKKHSVGRVEDTRTRREEREREAYEQKEKEAEKEDEKKVERGRRKEREGDDEVSHVASSRDSRTRRDRTRARSKERASVGGREEGRMAK